MDHDDLPIEHPAFDLLRRRVPVTLLFDLLWPTDSAQINATEPADVEWLTARRSA